jgi:hypothetical protein
LGKSRCNSFGKFTLRLLVNTILYFAISRCFRETYIGLFKNGDNLWAKYFLYYFCPSFLEFFVIFGFSDKINQKLGLFGKVSPVTSHIEDLKRKSRDTVGEDIILDSENLSEIDFLEYHGGKQTEHDSNQLMSLTSSVGFDRF